MDAATALIALIAVVVIAYLVTVIHAATLRTIAEREHVSPPETRLVAWPKWLLGAIVVLLALWLLYRVRSILTPFIIGGLLAYMLDPVIDRMSERGIHRSRAIWTTFVLFLLLLILAALLIIPAVANEARYLLTHYNDYVQGVRTFIVDAEQAIARWGKSVGVVPEDVRQAAAQLGTQAQQWGLGLLSSGLNWLKGSTSLLLLLIVTPVVTFWLLRDYHTLGRFLLRPLPEAHRQSTVEISREVNRIIGSYLLGILLMAAFTATYSSIVLTIFRVRFSILLGVMTGVFSIVPYFGYPTAMVIIGLIMVVTGQSALMIVIVIALHIFGNVTSDYLLYPRVVGSKVGLHPLVVIFALLAGGALLNFVGVLLAIPVAGIVKMLLLRFWPEFFASEEKPEVVKP